MEEESEFSEKYIEKTADTIYANLLNDGLSHTDILDVIALIKRKI